jgi:hypothetical protein
MTSRTHTPEDIKKIDDEFKEVLSTRLFKEKKEWVGLTHEDMTKIWSELYRKGPVLPTTFGMAIEAKLKEKNSE